MSKIVNHASFSVCHFYKNNQMGRRGKRFIPRITAVRENWPVSEFDRPQDPEESSLVIEPPEKEILTIAQGQTLFQIDSDNRIRLARLIELPQIDFSKVHCSNPSSKMIIRRLTLRKEYPGTGF